MIRNLLASAGLVCAGCIDFAPPSALPRDQILAVQATPPATKGPGVIELGVLSAGPSGIVQERAVNWSFRSPPPDDVNLSSESTKAYVDVQKFFAEETTVELLVAVEVGDLHGSLIASKSITLGADRDNPPAPVISFDGSADADADADAIPVRSDSIVLSADVADAHSITWYATVGSIDQFRSATTTLSFLEEKERNFDGTVIAVVRDGLGGVSYSVRRLQR